MNSNPANTLLKLLQSDTIVRLVGAHNALGGQLIEGAGFDAVWASGLEISATHGVPDANILSMSQVLQVTGSIASAGTYPRTR